MPDGGIQLDVFPTHLHLRRVDPERNMRRSYGMTVQPDLFDGANLIRIWGRIETRGRHLIDTDADDGSAISALMKLAEEKRRRGYML